MTLREALRAAERELAEAGCETPGLDARVLLEHVTGYDTAALVVRDGEEIGDRGKRFLELVQRRRGREPVAYLIGHKEFFSLRFDVGPEVLVPRPETELLVETCLRELVQSGSRDSPTQIADVGTGSGAIAVSVAAEVRAGRGGSAPVCLLAIDRCAQALAVARANAQRILSSGGPPLGHLSLLQGDLTRALRAASLDFLLANPPYLSPRELAGAPPELGFEPWLALAGGSDDGLGVVRDLLEEAQRVLRPTGLFLCEVGSSQGEEVASLAGRMGFSGVEVIRDLEGRPRLLRAGR